MRSAARPDAQAVRQLIGVVFQAPSLDKKLTVAENLKHQGHLYGLSGSDSLAAAAGCHARSALGLTRAGQRADRNALRRPAAAGRTGQGHDSSAPSAAARRTEHRTGPRRAERSVDVSAIGAGGARGHHRADDPLAGRGRKGRSDCHFARRRAGGGSIRPTRCGPRSAAMRSRFATADPQPLARRHCRAASAARRACWTAACGSNSPTDIGW